MPIVEPIEAGDAAPVTTPLAVAEAETSDAPKTRRRPRARKAAPVASEAVETPVVEEAPAPVAPVAEGPVAEEEAGDQSGSVTAERAQLSPDSSS